MKKVCSKVTGGVANSKKRIGAMHESFGAAEVQNGQTRKECHVLSIEIRQSSS